MVITSIKSHSPKDMSAVKHRLIKSIIDQFNLLTTQPENLKKSFQKLISLYKKPIAGSDIKQLEQLFPLMQKRGDPCVNCLFVFLKKIAEKSPDPVKFLKPMLSVRNRNLVLEALKYTLYLAQRGLFIPTRTFILFLAERIKTEGQTFSSKGTISYLKELVHFYPPGKLSHPDPVLALYLEEDNLDIRRLAALVLDSLEKTIQPEIAKTILGEKFYTIFAPYFAYTHISYTDLLYLDSDQTALSSLCNDFSRAEKIIDRNLFCEVIAELGWSHINYGLKVKALAAVTIKGSPPFMVTEEEASLLEMCGGTRQSSIKYIITASGGRQSYGMKIGEHQDDSITRFRSYNLNHAVLLSDFLDIGPLTLERVHNIIGRMDKIVDDFVTLFSSYSDECAILPGLYQDLKSRIYAELNGNIKKPPFSADLTRLILSFEDPHSLGNVRTLHGLKRYLHQQGLHLGFRLVEGNRSPNRTIDIVLATKDGIQMILNKIRYADFEPAVKDNRSISSFPFAIDLMLDAFTRQIFHGQDQFPYVDIFCYGNEVHYYFSFRNHPAFLRIDFAPPLRGGMIDLEYYGVSNYELNQHPNISLDSIRIFFKHLEFDIHFDGTHVHARYDKERALNMADLIKKAHQVLCLAPYLMDLDWVIGSLALSNEAQIKVAESWKNFFSHWGFIPVKSVLSKNRSNILTGIVDEPTGRREIIWSGQGDYVDIYRGLPPDGFYDDLCNIINISRSIISRTGENNSTILNPGQLDIEDKILYPLRKSVERGELIQTSEGFKTKSEALFICLHESEFFAELLANDADKTAKAIAIANLVRPLEKNLKFHRSGNINGFMVQNAVFPVRGEEIIFYVLRSRTGIIHLAFFIRDQVLYKKRKNKSDAWVSNACFDVFELANMLRVNNFTDSLPEQIKSDDITEASRVLEEIRMSTSSPETSPLRDEKITTGLTASPGRAVGKAVFGTEGRDPQDLRGKILVTPFVTPQDTCFLYYADGIISTGGGILSHAGLIATQFGKPALIIRGNWQTISGQQSVLNYYSLQYQVVKKNICGFNVSINRDVHEKNYVLKEGDLLILDAWEAKMHVLGQGRDVLTLYEGFRLYNHTNKMLSAARTDREILKLRGKLLHARHQLENVLHRCTNLLTIKYALFEILLNDITSDTGILHRDKTILISILINHPTLKNDVQKYLMTILTKLQDLYIDSFHKAEHNISSSDNVHEILSLRLDTIKQRQIYESVTHVAKICNLETSVIADLRKEKIESMVRDQLSVLKKYLIRNISSSVSTYKTDKRLRHFLDQLKRIDQILNVSKTSKSTINAISERLSQLDVQKRKRLSDCYIIKHYDCGFELFDFIGWKAANLAEIEHLSGRELIPPWFVITDKAFQETLELRLSKTESGYVKEGFSLRETINKILSRDNLDNHQKSVQIRGLWENLRLPEKIIREVIESYREITNTSDRTDFKDVQSGSEYVAVRSSSQEEDTETAARAGEFETYLYIHGHEQLIYYLKRTWSGLWTERAIHNRLVLGGDTRQTGGGVIIQRMVYSRVSGVLQTINISKNNLREMIINVGLGLGEGIVSGIVSADQVTVLKDFDREKESLRFSYITSDKTGQIVFNRNAGFGTVYEPTLYHQRLRPALEYVELCQLVSTAISLEKAYGYPLDIEFGIEGNRLWLLQVRPVASYLSVLMNTMQRYPLTHH